MKQVRIPYTNNLIERLMGKNAKRVKDKWMRWSVMRLENLLNILREDTATGYSTTRVKQKYLNQGQRFIEI